LFLVDISHQNHRCRKSLRPWLSYQDPQAPLYSNSK